MLNKVEKIPEWLAGADERNKGTLWQVIKAYRANQRQGTVGVKTRAMVASTGKKPYKQKKTGGARRGSFVSPLHVGGGVAHGPKARDYRENIPVKMGSLALMIALAERIKGGGLFLGSLEVASGKTGAASKLLGGALNKVGETIVCLNAPSAESIRAYRNLRGVRLVSAEKLNAFDVTKARSVIMSKECLSALETRIMGEGE
jgi:large subunit ribosomal protein L4